MAPAAVLFAMAITVLAGFPAGILMDGATPSSPAMTDRIESRGPAQTSPDRGRLWGTAEFPGLGSAFIQNRGQLGNNDVQFFSTGALSIFFSAGRIDYSLQTPERAGAQGREEPMPPDDRPGVFGMQFVGGNDVIPHGIEPLPFQCNYFLGNDPERWVTGVQAFGAVIYEGIYDGIDIEFRPFGEGMKYQFTVLPGADPSAIRLLYTGADVLATPKKLLLTTPAGVVSDDGLAVFQDGEKTGRCAVDARFFASGNEVTFELGTYDHALPLMIDPLVSPAINFSTLIGGAGSDVTAGMALDALGNAYVTGETLSQDFPATQGSFDNVSKICATARYDVFVLKLSPDGKRILWCTFLGSSGNDYAHGIAVDDYGFAYICGNCFDFDFPVTGFAADGSYNGYGDVFVTKLNPAGSALVFSTFIGGEYVDHGYAIALDASRNIFLTGSTASMEFPTTEGAFCRSIHAGTGLDDAFVAKLYANGSTLAYATFLGGGGLDRGTAIAVDGLGRAAVAGGTDSSDFPISAGAPHDPYSGMDIFVTRLDEDGSAIGSSILIGGHADDSASAIVFDREGRAVIAGTSASHDFPDTTSHMFTFGQNGVVFGLDANGTELLFSRQLGGSSDDSASAVGLDLSGNVHVAGTTSSRDLPVTKMAASPVLQGSQDAYIVKLDANASNILYSSYIGGGQNDSAVALALDAAGRACVAGDTASDDFPVTAGPRHQGGTDVFVLKLDVICTPSEPVLRASARDREVALDWTPPIIGGETVIRYDIYRGPSQARLQKFLSMDASATVAHDRMVQNGEAYYYSILAVNSSGEGTMSAPVYAMPGLPPSEPWGLAASAGPGFVMLSWQAPNRTYDLPVLSYKIFRWRTFIGGSLPLLSVTNGTSYNDTGPTNDFVHFYEVSAVTRIGEGPPSDAVSATPSGFPSPPPDLSADVIGRQVVLGWKTPQNPGSYPIMHYLIYGHIDGDRERLLANTSATVFMTQRLPAGTYHFRVAAVSGYGTGYKSDEATVTVKNQPPAVSATSEPTSGTSATRFNFTPNAFDPDGLIANYSWSFGDGGRAFKEDPFHIYKRRGTYNVTLRVTDDDGAIAFSNITVEVLNTPPRILNPDPPSDISLYSGERGEFGVLPVDPDEDTLHVSWYLDDVKTAEGSHFSASIEKEGFHRIRAVADDGKDSVEYVWTVAVKGAPAAPSQPPNYYAIGLISAVIVAAGGAVWGLRRRRRQKKVPPARAKGAIRRAPGQRGKMAMHRPPGPPGKPARPTVRKGRKAGKQSKRIL